jgi:hypothetical protein
MIKKDKLLKMNNCADLLPPPGAEVVRELLQEIFRLHTKLDYISRHASQHEIKEFAKEDI